ncbi:hypothetical protein [Ruminiclostridium cellobioparum]|uniref:hypothetical protein n=1 Tax=Ruminiclostridium cellobioparum TaxID=29355 RepID=UPI0028AE13DA|nr:hypothetical protein [Ruminiclostridium cellobioparum]
MADNIIRSNELNKITPGAVHITVGISFMFLCNHYSAGKSIFDSMVSKMRLSGAFKDAVEGFYELI